MAIEIIKYNPTDHKTALLDLIRSEGEEWQDYVTHQYEVALENSITYVALQDGKLCGYVRALNDNGIFIWVVDLLVHVSHRGNAIGKRLMERVRLQFSRLDVYVMSDVDAYYQKLKYQKEGSIFKVG